ncbi:Stage II sporulation protein R [compost metagenome]
MRVTLGAGRGQNWWCVLFPPLCFIDAGSGDAAAPAAAKAKTVSAAAAGEGAKVKAAGEGAVTAPDTGSADAAGGEPEAPKVRFFFWELLENIWSWISGLFS